MLEHPEGPWSYNVTGNSERESLKIQGYRAISSQAPESAASMGKVQRLGSEPAQAINYPRVPGIQIG